MESTGKMRILAAALLTVACGIAEAQNVRPSSEAGMYLVTSGDVTMTVNASEGGKIFSFKLGEKEILSQRRLPNQYGSTFWTSPQAEWSWPPVREIDRDPYEASIDGGVLTLKGKTAEKLPYAIEKRFIPDGKGRYIRVIYTIRNMGTEARKVAPWEISRVESDESGLIFFDAPVSQILAASGEMIPFREEAGVSWYSFEQTSANRKVNSDGKGWLAYAASGMLLVKKFTDITPDEPAPGEAEIQVYVNAGKSYIELESQGAYQVISPGESLSWSVDWFLLPLDSSKAAAPKKLLKMARKAIRVS